MEFYLRIGRNSRRKSIGAVPPPAHVDEYPQVISSMVDDGSCRDYVNEFFMLPEVAFPVIYIISRIKNAEIVLRRYEDDSEVWVNDKLYGEEALLAKAVHGILERPNFYQDFKAFTEQYFLQRYLTGNTFCYADGVLDNKDRWKYVDQLHVIPTRSVNVRTKTDYNLFSSKEWKDIIDHYDITGNGKIQWIDVDSMMFTRDLQNLEIMNELKSRSRLDTQRKCIELLKEVYSARYSIYAKRGPLGAISSQKHDADGSIPMTEDEKKSIRNELMKKYGTGKGKDLYAIVDNPVQFIKLGSNIQELQPFVETLNDATQIAAIFNIKKELIPRDDNSTFSNQEEAEISVYNDMVIPETKQYLDNISDFLGIKDRGYYLDCRFDKVDVLKSREREKVEADKKRLETELAKFNAGVNTLNDVLTSMGMEAKNDKLYSKTLFEMNVEERNMLGR